MDDQTRGNLFDVSVDRCDDTVKLRGKNERSMENASTNSRIEVVGIQISGIIALVFIKTTSAGTELELKLELERVET